MTEYCEHSLEIHSSNKDKLHKQKMRDTLNDLLTKYDADDLINYIMQQEENN